MRFLTFAFIFLVLENAAAGQTQYIHYENARFNYQVQYPDFLHPQGNAWDASGQTFVGKGATLKIFGSFFPETITPLQLKGVDLASEYQHVAEALKKDHFIISNGELQNNAFILKGENNNQAIFIKKLLIPSCGMHLYLKLYYPPQQKLFWEDIIEQMKASFKYSSLNCHGNYRNFP